MAISVQLQNSYHAQLKGMINVRFRGVETKHRNNYLMYHNLANFTQGSDEHKEIVMLDFTLTTACVSKNHDISKRQAISV